jgi:nitrogen fixation protein NifB
LINRHFGHAKWFLVYDIEEDGTSTLVERREVTPWCRKDNHDGEEGASGIADAIADCKAVLTAMIGGPARKKLELSGLSVFEEPAEIDGALKKLAAYWSRTVRGR